MLKVIILPEQQPLDQQLKGQKNARPNSLMRTNSAIQRVVGKYADEDDIEEGEDEDEDEDRDGDGGRGGRGGGEVKDSDDSDNDSEKSETPVAVKASNARPGVQKSVSSIMSK